MTQYLYDGRNRVESAQYLADGTSVATAYDALGNPIAMTDSVGTTSTEYDNLNRPLVITDALGVIVYQAYDLVGNRTQVTYPTGEVVTSAYDGDNRLRTVTAWDGGVTSYAYDSAGRMITMTLPNGVQSSASYDHADRLTQISHTAPGGLLLGQYQYQLDGSGLAQVVTETLRSPEAASLTERFLESGGLVVMEAEHGTTTAGSSHDWISQTVQSGYGGPAYLRALPDIGQRDETGELTGSPRQSFPIQIDNPADYAVWIRGMAPDAGGDSLHIGLEAATGSAQALTGFAPNEWSWASVTMSATQASLDLNASGTYTLDLWMREDGLRVDRVLLITDTNHIPTGVGPAESQRDTVGGGGVLTAHVINYEYDPLRRLTSATVSGDLTASYGYAYDALGNRMSYTAALTNTVVTTYTYDLANRLQTAKSDDSPTAWHYVYDNNGRRLQQLPGGLPPAEGAVQYSYDQSNRLIRVETHDGGGFQLQAEMVYDGRGNRLQAITYGTESTAITATYTLDPRGGLPLMVDNGINTAMILYGQTAIGEYAVQTAEWAYYLGDAQLSVRQLVDGNGNATQSQTYGPYGVLLHQEGDGGGLFGYQGGQAAANGLWYFGDGYFDPNTGQFLSRNGNPLLPLAAAAMANPGGFLLGPVLFIHWRRRKKGKGRIHPTTLLLFGVLLAAGLSGCREDPTPTPESPIIPSPTGTSTPTPTVTVTQVSTPTSTATVVTITAKPPCELDPATLPTKIIFFAGSWGNGLNPETGKDFAEEVGPDGTTEGEVQTPVWDSIADYWYQYPGYVSDDPDSNSLNGKNLQAATAIANFQDLKEYNLLVIGYSSGADAALIFAQKFYEKKGIEGCSGNITGLALLGTTVTNPQVTSGDKMYFNLGTDWKGVLNDLLVNKGTDVYVLNDEGVSGNTLSDEYTPPGNATGRYLLDVRDSEYDSTTVTQQHYNDYHIPGTYGYEHGWTPEGTNNSELFRKHVLDFFGYTLD